MRPRRAGRWDVPPEGETAGVPEPHRPAFALRRVRAATLLAWLAVATAAGCGGGQPDAPEPTPEEEGTPAAPGANPDEPGAGVLTQQDERRVSLLFPAADGESLLPETRIIFLTNTLTSQVKQAVAELLAGPTGDNKVAPFPVSTPLRAVFLMRDGTAVIDLGREATQIPPGSASETDAVFALVNTLVVNFPEVARVQILIEGEEIDTLTGHLDTSRPLAADLRRVRWGKAGLPASARGRFTEPSSDEPDESPSAEPAAGPPTAPLESTRADLAEAPAPE